MQYALSTLASNSNIFRVYLLYVREARIWNPEKFCLCLLVESQILDSRIQLKESGIAQKIGIENPVFTYKDWNPVPRIWNPWHGIPQFALDSLTWSECMLLLL